MTELDQLKFAHRIDEATLHAAGVELADLPEAYLLRDEDDEQTEGLEDIEDMEDMEINPSSPTSEEKLPQSESTQERIRPVLVRQVVAGRATVRNTAQPLSRPVAVIPKAGEIQEEVAKQMETAHPSISRQTLASTNRGKSPRSRRYVRGILHPAPMMVWGAAVLSILIRVICIACVVLLALLFFKKVPTDFIWGLLALPIMAVPYFMAINKARCRVCGQKEFLPNGARKHVKAHRFLTPIIGTALHVIFYRWFYCMFCGTAVRLKK